MNRDFHIRQKGFLPYRMTYYSPIQALFIGAHWPISIWCLGLPLLILANWGRISTSPSGGKTGYVMIALLLVLLTGWTYGRALSLPKVEMETAYWDSYDPDARPFNADHFRVQLMESETQTLWTSEQLKPLLVAWLDEHHCTNVLTGEKQRLGDGPGDILLRDLKGCVALMRISKSGKPRFLGAVPDPPAVLPDATR